MLSTQKQNKSPAQNSNKRLRAAKKNIAKQAVLAAFTISITLVLLFAMTTAWYTNVIQTQGLTFEAESWGFDGTVTFPEGAIDAAPGDEGVVTMSVTNNSNSATAITVNVSKEFMSSYMWPRIYFYVEKDAVINGESVQKQYLSNTSGYTYQLFGWNTLTLSETVRTDAPLKWEWVYDVVGYYFRGSVSSGGVEIEDYLRPVEYDYDQAVFDENGSLTHVDADTTAAEFLAEVTASDGYEGAITAVTNEDGTVTASRTPINGCYKIADDIWLYLCTKSEIDANTKWDTEFATGIDDEGARSFYARITLTGQQILQDPVMLADPSALESTLNENSGGVVRLESDLMLTDPITVDEGVDVVLDLNDHQLTYSGTEPAFTVGSGAELTVANGTVTSNDDKTTSTNVAFKTVGGALTLSNVTVSNVYDALLIEDHTSGNDGGANSTVRIVGCELNSYDDTIRVYGDGAASSGTTHLVVQNSVLTSETYVAILGNGSMAAGGGRWGTDIQIVGSTVTGYYAAVYHPQPQSSLTVSGSFLSGITGVVMKGGSLTVVDSDITGTGEDGQVDVLTPGTSLSGSGFSDSGDGIYVETNYNYAVTVSISGDSNITCTADTARALRMFPEANHVRWDITGGAYSTDVADYLNAARYQCTYSNSDGLYTVTAIPETTE